SGWYPVSANTKSFFKRWGPDGVCRTTKSAPISCTVQLKRATISPALMRFSIVMEDFVQVLAGDANLVREIVVAGGDHDLARAVVVNGAVPVRGGDTKLTVTARNRLHPFVLADVQMIVLGDAAVIFERFEPRGLGQGCSERDIANLE